MYKRTYFEQDNTIVFESEYNFGNSNIVDLFYGGGGSSPFFSRYLFRFDVYRLKQHYSDCELGDLSLVTHKLKFKHAGFEPTPYACMPSSYKICLFSLDRDWVEGCGVSDDCGQLCTNYAKLGCTVSKSPSNWYYSQSGVTWQTGGTYDSIYQDPEYILCQDIDCSSPDLEIDVTDIVNNLIETDTLNYGFGLAFHYDLEREISNVENHVVFFSKETNTFFEPYLETQYINPIHDDRTKFYLDKENRLYLFVGVDGENVNLDENPIVEIYDETSTLQFTLTGTCQDKGIYYVEFEVDSGSIERCFAWTDNWTNLKINGKTLPDYSMQFNLIPAENYYTFGYKTHTAELDFRYGFRGIKRDEVIKRGDIRKIYVDIKSPSNPFQQISVDNVFYKIYLKEGAYDETTIIDWMPLNVGVCENWFMLDTSWMIPQSYIIDFKVVNKQTVKTYPEQVKFHVIE